MTHDERLGYWKWRIEDARDNLKIHIWGSQQPAVGMVLIREVQGKPCNSRLNLQLGRGKKR